MSLLMPVLLIVLALIFEYLTVKHALDGIEYSLEVRRQAVECDENFELVTTLTSRKLYPVLHLFVSEQIPFDMAIDAGSTGAKTDTSELISRNPKKYIQHTLYLMPRQRVRRTVTASLPARGRYTMQSAELRVGDLLGLTERQENISHFKEVVVYPRRADIRRVEEALGGYLGDVSVRRFILNDPILTCGFREYTGHEPMKDVAWPQSLKEGRLMVKQYDYTSEPSAAVLLNTAQTVRDRWAVEECYSLTRCVMERLEAMHTRYSFFTNTDTASASGRWSYMAAGVGDRHFYSILEGLGRATCDTRFGVARLLELARLRCENESAIIFVTPCLDAASREALHRFEAHTGRRVFTVEAAYGEEVRDGSGDN